MTPLLRTATALAFCLTVGVMEWDAQAAAGLTVSWTNNLLSVARPNIPGGNLEILYLEAFCRSNSANRDWRETTLPHKTTLMQERADGTHLRLRTRVEPDVEVIHDVTAKEDEIEFVFSLNNRGDRPIDLNWFQPACIRVDRFTGAGQSNYINKSFIFTERGLTTMDRTERREEALYRGGQVYVPAGINLRDVNPRPISPTVPVNGLIGCFSADGHWILATAWDQTHELFQGVYTCLHADPHVGGLQPGQTKKVRGKLYLFQGDEKELLKRYRRDFGK